MYTPIGFTGDDGSYDAPVTQCESETCRQHYGEAQRVHLLSPATGEVMDTRTFCQKAREVANQSYGVTLAIEPCYIDEEYAGPELERMAA